MPSAKLNETEYHHALLVMEYDGAPFYGWTRQPGALPTIESELLGALSILRCDGVRLRCAGRTDAGVHARWQVVDLKYRGPVAPERLSRAITGNVRDELAVRSSMRAPEGFDARSDATSRAYEYRVLTHQENSPLRRGQMLHHPRFLDFELLQQAATMLLGQHRFTAFTPSKTGHTFFDRTIVHSRWVKRADELVYEIRANAFLRHMVRILVGTMLSIARGDATLDELSHMLDGGLRSNARETAPPHGLSLVDVTWEPVEKLSLAPSWSPDRVAELVALVQAGILDSGCSF